MKRYDVLYGWLLRALNSVSIRGTCLLLLFDGERPFPKQMYAISTGRMGGTRHGVMPMSRCYITCILKPIDRQFCKRYRREAGSPSLRGQICWALSGRQ